MLSKIPHRIHHKAIFSSSPAKKKKKGSQNLEVTVFSLFSPTLHEILEVFLPYSIDVERHGLMEILGGVRGEQQSQAEDQNGHGVPRVPSEAVKEAHDGE